MGDIEIEVEVNGASRRGMVPPRLTLADFLRAMRVEWHADRMGLEIAEVAIAGIRYVIPNASLHEVSDEVARRRCRRRLADAAFRRCGAARPASRSAVRSDRYDVCEDR